MPHFPLRLLLVAVSVVAALRAGAAYAGPLRSLTIVDDRGLPVAAAVEVCFQLETKSECSTVRKAAVVQVPPNATSARLEGPEHGPLTLSRGAWEEPSGETSRVALPRKARIAVKVVQGERLTLSLYSQQAADFRHPAYRLELPASGVAWVPAGSSVVSLAASGRAADLHFLDAAPGGSYRLPYRPAHGWSQIFRCQVAREETPLEGASVRLTGSEGFTTPEAPTRVEKSNRNGLVLFSGLPYLLASAKVEHPAFVLRREEGLSASPGTFGFREVGLEAGGTLRAQVTLEGQPAEGVRCQILEVDANPIGPAGEPDVRSETLTDRKGQCLSVKLAAGPYTLRLRLPVGQSFVDRSFRLADGEETALELSLEAIRVYGKVVRGSQPAPSYVVLFSDQNEVKPNGTRKDAQAEAITNEDGDYEAFLWSAGDYYAILQTPMGTPAAHRRLRLEGGEERSDFYLSEHGVGGVVTDERDRPLKEASVVLRWHGAVRLARTDPQGTFFFPIAEDGQGELAASKAGYLSPSPRPVVVGTDGQIPAQTFRLRRSGLLAGKVVARGPVDGASLLSYRVAPDGRSQFLGAARTDRNGGFELAGAEGGATRIYVTGPGCPLAPFTVQLPTDDLTFQCPELPASAEVRFADTRGHPIAGKSVLARKDGVVVPAEVLSRHLAQLRLPTASDGNGRLLLVGLGPGSYDLFLAEATSPDLVATGDPNGFLVSATLAPLSTSELAVTLETQP